MTPLRSRMLEDMQLHGYVLHGYAPTTQKIYVNSIARLAQFYHQSPDQISEEELRNSLAGGVIMVAFYWRRHPSALRAAESLGLPCLGGEAKAGRPLAVLWKGPSRWAC